MRFIAVIPAHLEAQRFPGKLLVNLLGKTVLQRTYEAVVQAHLFDEVWVATNSDAIEQHIKSLGGLVYRSKIKRVTMVLTPTIPSLKSPRFEPIKPQK